jgi:LPS export ABC transporter protein LptC
MLNSAKQATWLSALFVAMLFFAACENDINKINAISNNQSIRAVDSTTDVDVVYSDSARVKLHMTSPLLLHHDDLKHPEKAYEEMPHGVRIVFYDTTRKESGTIVADSAIQHTKAQIIEFHKNVVATNPAGDTYRSDELIWDQAKKIIYSNKPVQLTTHQGNVMNGMPFTSDEKLTQPKFGHATGLIHVTEDAQN